VVLPTPAAILGSLDPNAGATDPTQGRVPCLRESPAHAHFLFLFAKTVVMQDAYRKNTRELLGGFMCPNLEAFAVLTYTNNYDCWKEECEIQALPPEERANRTPVAVRRFTDRARGAGRYRGWDSAGITMYNDLAARIKLQVKDPNLANFERELQAKWRTSANLPEDVEQPVVQADGQGVNHGLDDDELRMELFGEEIGAGAGSAPAPAMHVDAEL
jgi:hypothetical protein